MPDPMHVREILPGVVAGAKGHADPTWYQKYLLSDHWKATREWALERASRCCQLCRAKVNLRVHHNTYARLGKELPSDLVVLCVRCHDRHHELIAQVPEVDPRVVQPSPNRPGKWNVLRGQYRGKP